MKNIKLKYFLIFILLILIVYLLVKLYFKNFSKEYFFQQNTTSTYSHRPVGAILYQNSPSQSGWQSRITEGNWDFQTFTSIFGVQNDDTSWIRVNPGYIAILYQHGELNGMYGEFSAGDHNLTTSGIFPSNVASSIKVISERSEPIGAILYQHGDNKGWAARFPVGEYNSQDYVNQGAILDDASSIVVNSRYKATLYTGSNLDGDAVEFTQSSNSFGSNNDNFKSIKVELLSSSNPTTSASLDRYLTCNNNQFTANYNQIIEAVENNTQVPNADCKDICNDNQYLSNYDQVISAINNGNQVPDFICSNITNCNENQYVSRAAERINNNNLQSILGETNIGTYKSDVTCSNLSTCGATYPSNRDPQTEANMCRQYITRTHQVGSKDNFGSNREFRDFREPRMCNDPNGAYPLEYLQGIPRNINGFFHRDKTYRGFTDINRCDNANIYDPNNPN